MTPLEIAHLRDRVARAELGVEVAPGPRVYPVPGRASIVECPVHRLVVALDGAGRVASSCPACRRQADTWVAVLAGAA